MIGNSSNAWDNKTCGSQIEYGGSRRCDLLGKYVSVYKVVDFETGMNICCIPELGVYTTIDIVPNSDITFEGTA